MHVIQVMDGVRMSALAQSWGSWEHSVEIWCAVRPINPRPDGGGGETPPHLSTFLPIDKK